MRWMNLEPIIQSEVSQKEKDKYCILKYIYMESRKTVFKNLFTGQQWRKRQRTDLWTWGEGRRRWDACCCCSVTSVTSDSVWPYRRQPTRLPRPWDSPGKNTGVVAISFSNAWKWKVKVKLLSRAWLLGTPWTAAYQAPPFMGFSRQEYWSGVPLPSPGKMYGKSNMETYITICKIDGQWEFAVWLRKLK